MGPQQRNLFNEELQKAAMIRSTILQLTDATVALHGFAVTGIVAINVWKSFDRFSSSYHLCLLASTEAASL